MVVTTLLRTAAIGVLVAGCAPADHSHPFDGPETLVIPASAHVGDTITLAGTVASSCRDAVIRVSATSSSPAFDTLQAAVTGGRWQTTYKVREVSVPVPVRGSVSFLAECSGGSGATIGRTLMLTR